MTETATETGTWPELGAKSPEKTDKPRSAPRERKGDNTGNKDRREPARERRQREPDNGEPLVKPTPVEEPDQRKQDEYEKNMRAEIEADEAKVTELNEQIDKVRDERGEHNESIKVVKAELQSMRDEWKKVAAERDQLVEQLKRHSEIKRQQDQKVQRLRKELKVMDSASIDSAIAEMTNKLETSVMDLKSEKAILYEIKKLNTHKEQLKEFEAEKAKVDAAKGEHDEMYKRRQEVGDLLVKMRQAEQVVADKIDAMRNGEGTADGIAPNDKMKTLLDQKAKILDGVKAKRAAIKESSGQFRAKVALHREYQKSLEAYERKVGHREYLARKEEQAARNAAYKQEKQQRETERKAERERQEKRFAIVASGVQMFVGGLALRTTEEELRAHFEQYAPVLDSSIVKDSETKVSKGFGFVVVATKELADVCIKESNGKELRLCPAHNRLSVKMAQKSKQQAEWEAAQKKKSAPKAEESSEEKKETSEEGGGKEKKKGKGGKKQGKSEAGAEGAKEDVIAVDESAADDFFGAFGTSDSVGKVELPPKAAEEKKPAEEKKEGWKATRTEWVNNGEEASNPASKSEEAL